MLVAARIAEDAQRRNMAAAAMLAVRTLQGRSLSSRDAVQGLAVVSVANIVADTFPF